MYYSTKAAKRQDYKFVAEPHIFFYLFSLIFYLEKSHIFREE